MYNALKFLHVSLFVRLILYVPVSSYVGTGLPGLLKDTTHCHR